MSVFQDEWALRTELVTPFLNHFYVSDPKEVLQNYQKDYPALCQLLTAIFHGAGLKFKIPRHDALDQWCQIADNCRSDLEIWLRRRRMKEQRLNDGTPGFLTELRYFNPKGTTIPLDFPKRMDPTRTSTRQWSIDKDVFNEKEFNDLLAKAHDESIQSGFQEETFESVELAVKDLWFAAHEHSLRAEWTAHVHAMKERKLEDQVASPESSSNADAAKVARWSTNKELRRKFMKRNRRLLERMDDFEPVDEFPKWPEHNIALTQYLDAERDFPYLCAIFRAICSDPDYWFVEADPNRFNYRLALCKARIERLRRHCVRLSRLNDTASFVECLCAWRPQYECPRIWIARSANEDTWRLGSPHHLNKHILALVNLAAKECRNACEPGSILRDIEDVQSKVLRLYEVFHEMVLLDQKSSSAIFTDGQDEPVGNVGTAVTARSLRRREEIDMSAINEQVERHLASSQAGKHLPLDSMSSKTSAPLGMMQHGGPLSRSTTKASSSLTEGSASQPLRKASSPSSNSSSFGNKRGGRTRHARG